VTDSEIRCNAESVRERDMMAGKTAPASLMQFSSAHMNGTWSGLDCLGKDKNVELMKPYKSAPNIDLLCHTEVGRGTPPNVAEYMLLRGTDPVGKVDEQVQSIPEIVVVCSSDENVSVVETCTQSQEPDIVQSTKSSSLPRQGMVQQPAQPVAPPRKKRIKTKSPLSTDSTDEVCLYMCIKYPHFAMYC